MQSSSGPYCSWQRSETRNIAARWLAMCVVAVAAVAAGPGSTRAEPSIAFAGLAGTWSGGGQLRLDDGKTERLTCRASYLQRAGGDNLGLSIRCASTSYKLELRSSLSHQGGKVSGTWEERNFNAGGELTGRAAAGALNLAFTGSVSGTLSVSYGATSQRVTIMTSGGGMANVSINLTRG